MSRRLLRSHRLAFAVTGSLATGFLLMPVAHAQSAEPVTTKEAESSSTTKKAEKKSERIQVTGSRIKRTEVEGVSSVIQIDQEAIQKSGVNSVGELLQQMAVSIDGSYSNSIVNDVRGNVTNVNLRGLGPENTLVLLDGRRLPDEGGLGVVDLSIIPMAAVERIEVLKDSASAIYGSDATGGVVNIITKKDFEGNAVFARASKPAAGKGGEGMTLSYVSGTQTGDLHVLAALSYKHSEPVFWRDRDWTRQGVSSYANPANLGLTTQVRNPDGSLALNEDGTVKTKTAYYGANCGGATFPDGQCQYNYANTMAFQPEATQLAFLSNIDYRINDRVQLYSTLRAQQNKNLWNMAPNAGSFDIPASTLQLNPGLNLSGGELAPGTGAQVKYRATPWGNRTWEETNNVYGGNVGLRGDLTANWEWNVSAGHSQSRKDSKNPSGFFLKDLVTDSIADGRFNPLETNLAGNAQMAAIINQAAYVPQTINESAMNTYDANFTGPLFGLPGGQAALAVGVSRFDQTYKKNIDDVSQAGNVFGVTEDKSGSGDRTVNAVYAEIDLPVLKQLELQAAVRHDQYSDFGSTTNPKAGFKFKPVNSFLVRGNVGTGFKAPTLNQIYNGGSIGLDNLYDTPNIGNIADRQDEVEIETYGNPDLKQETSLSWNAGVVADPIDGLSLSADYWYIKINDIIRPVDAQRALDAAAEGAPLPGIEIFHVNNDPTGPLRRIRVPTANLGKSEDAGVDTSAEYRFRAASSRFLIGTEYSRKIYSKTVAFPTAPQRDVLGERGHPYWRMINTGGWNVANHGVVLRNNIISKQKKTPTPELTGTLSSYSTYDAQYVWNHPWNGSIAIGALNVFAKDFPKDDTERTGDDQRVMELYPTDGRLLYVNINQTF